MNGLLSGNMNVTVTFDKDNTAQTLAMIFFLVLVSAVVIKIISKF